MPTHLINRMFKAYKDAKKVQVGNYLRRFYKDETMWPEGLVDWWAEKVETLPSTLKWRGLTVGFLLEYMAEVTGLIQLAEEGDYGRYYEDRLSEWGRWENDTKRGGMDPLLIIAMCSCEILKDENSHEILDTPEKFVNFMMKDD